MCVAAVTSADEIGASFAEGNVNPSFFRPLRADTESSACDRHTIGNFDREPLIPLFGENAQ